MDLKKAGRAAYDAAVAQQHGKYANGEAMPHWENLAEAEKLKWGEVALAVLEHLKADGWKKS